MLSSAKISLTIAAAIAAASPNTLAPATGALNYTKTLSLANGTLVDQADKIFVKPDSVASGTPDTHDLSGALTDSVGDTAVFAEVVAIVVVNKSTTVGAILSVAGNFITNAFGASTSIPIPPGGFICIAAPAAAAYTVTNTSADTLSISAAAGTIDYDLIVIGRSA